MPFEFETTPRRSKNMAAIRSSGNVSTEQRFVHILRMQQLKGWRRQLALPGKPDFAFPKSKVAIFVDGCFWHFCPRCTKIPKQNTGYWVEKRCRNKARDKRVSHQLRERGWHVLRFWEHTLINDEVVASRIRRALSKC